MEKHDSASIKQLRNRIRYAEQVKLVLGAGDVWYGPEWIATNQEDLDILCAEDWEFLFGPGKRADFIFAEHVWEHFTWKEAFQANRNVFNYLKPGGNFRIAVPDGFFPDPEYIEHVRPGGTGAGADDHKILYNHKSLMACLHKVPFRVELLEYFDEQGKFHEGEWEVSAGLVGRSAFFDERNHNREGKLKYTSIIADCKK